MTVFAAAAGGIRVGVMDAVTDRGRIMTGLTVAAKGRHRANTLGAWSCTQDAAQVDVKLMTACTTVVLQAVGRIHRNAC